MTRNISLASLLLVLVLVVGGCGQTSDAPSGPRLGDATRHNMSLRIVNPDPAPLDRPAPAMDGARAKAAMERYKTGAVIEVEVVPTDGTARRQ